MKRFEFNAEFKSWKKGDVLEEYEYNRLPFEMKKYATEIVPVKEKAKPKPLVVVDEPLTPADVVIEDTYTLTGNAAFVKPTKPKSKVFEG